MTRSCALALSLALVACQGSEGSGSSVVAAGALAGTVVDQAGRAVADVSVTTSPLGLATVTAPDGSYAIADVPIGVYSVAFSGTNVERKTVTNVSVVAGNTITLDVTVSVTNPHAFDELQAICSGLAAQGATLVQADQALSGYQYASGFRCPSGSVLLAPFGGTCPAQTTDNPECAFFYEWQSTDPGLCNPQDGCCFICELRVMKGSISTSDGGASTPVCASRWLRGQPCQLL